MKRTQIAPGLMQIFRLYIGMQLTLLLMSLLSESGESPPEVLYYPQLGVINSTFAVT